MTRLEENRGRNRINPGLPMNQRDVRMMEQGGDRLDYQPKKKSRRNRERTQEFEASENDPARISMKMLPPDWVPYPEDGLEEQKIVTPITQSRRSRVTKLVSAILGITRRLRF